MMLNKVYLRVERYKDEEPKINVYTNLNEAVKDAKAKLDQMSNLKSKIKVYDVPSYPYFGLNLAEGILVTVEEHDIIFKTSGGYALNVPLAETDFVGR